MPLEFPCPSCGGRLKAPFAAAGILGACPNCSAQVIAPRQPGEDAAMAAPPPGTPLGPSPVTSMGPIGPVPASPGTGPLPAPPSAYSPVPFGAPRPGYGGAVPPTVPNPALDHPLIGYQLTEEGDYAGLVTRGIAWLIDTMVLAVVAGTLRAALWPHFDAWLEQSAVGRMGFLTLLVRAMPYTVLSILYGTVMEGTGRQATLGKRLGGIFVTTETGDPMTIWRALWRNIVKYASINLTGGLAVFLPAVRDMRQALHDSAAGTLVLNR